MPKFRKRPVVIEAVQWDGQNWEEVDAFLGLDEATGPGAIAYIIETLEGDMTARIGDWIIRGVKDEFYPCRDDIFAATYEPAEAAV